MTSHQFSDLSDDQLQSINGICASFEQALRRAERPRIEDYLDQGSSEIQHCLFSALFAAEIEFRTQQENSLEITEYRTRFPDRVDTVHQIFQKIVSAGQTLERTIEIGSDDTESAQTSAGSLEETQDSRDHRAADLGDMPESFGRYRILRKIGHGGMGAVYLAHDSQLDRKVALKVPYFGDDGSRTDAAIQRFYREARSMATVHHPNLCPIYDVGEIDGKHFLTMAYVDGKSLWDRLSTGQRFPADEAASLMRRLAEALQAAHQAGIVHRDVKPSNIMIDQRGEPIVMDFGLAQRQRPGEIELTKSGAVLGSPAYMSPEQVEAHDELIGPATDVYALGVVLYCMLCGRRPFEGSSASVLGQIVSAKRPAPPSQVTGVDPHVEAICLRAMAHAIEDRYPTALDLANALLEYLDTDPAKRKRIAAEKKHTTTGKRLLIAAAGLLVGLVALAVGMSRFGTDSSQVAGNSANEGTRSGESPDDKINAAARAATLDLRPRAPVPSVTGGGHFVVAEQVFPASTTVSAVGGDLDGDGDVDVVLGSEDGPNTVWLNDGSGRFSLSQELPGDSMSKVVLGDLDADGDFDLVVVNSSRVTPCFLWWNDGTGRFDQETPLDTMLAADLALGDIDDDGDLDAFIACRYEQNRVYRNDGSGRLLDSGQRLGSADSRAVAVGDFDGDGDLDALVANEQAACRLWMNDGQGNFHMNPQELGADNVLHSDVAAADLDGDGDLDAYVTRPMNFNQVWINDGTGLLSLEIEPPFKLPSSAVAVGDLNGDGLLDIVVGNGELGTRTPIQIQTNLGDRLSAQSLGFAATGAVAIDDFDLDGDLDLFLANRNAQPDQILLNHRRDQLDDWRSTNAFQDSGQRLGKWYSEDAKLGDVDGDGDLDVVVANYRESPNNLWLNDGTGHFQANAHPLGTFSTNGVELGDLDEDGDLDAFFKGRQGPNFVWLNDGHGVFADSGQRLGNSQGRDVALLDVDSDGDLDAITMSFDKPCKIWLNDGQANFSEAEQALEGAPALHVSVGDVDNDRDQDLVVRTARGSPHELWTNDGRGTFSRSPLPVEVEHDSMFSLADVDADSDLDLIVSLAQGVQNQLWINDGTGAFEPANQVFAALDSRRPAVGDLDGDGDTDILFPNSNHQPNDIWLNDGQGRFGSVVHWIGDSNSTRILLGDLDRDGDLDAFELNTYHQPNCVWFNRGAE